MGGDTNGNRITQPSLSDINFKKNSSSDSINFNNNNHNNKNIPQI